MSEIKIFESEQFGKIRTAGDAEQPLFCLVDVCYALGITNSRNVKNRLDEEDVRLVDTPTIGGVQSITFVNESGLYNVILRSDSEKAKPFRKWVTSEVLPSIRKHGLYATAEAIENILSKPENMIKVLQALSDERNQRKIAEEKAALLEEVTKEQAPKVVFANAVSGSTNSILLGEFAKILRQNGVEMGERRLFQWMREHNYLGKKGDRYNIPNQEYIERGYFTLKTNTFSINGEMITRNTTKITGKGQEYFINKFLG